ncbi:hypothetical protein HDU76_012385 [Blyttiomyces sp. JEL0837]|nr:hypothetical protein HDU76_012385 [Blyttiomyces sp. JEL0837]
MTKLSIPVENDEDLYEFKTEVRCFACGNIKVDESSVSQIVVDVMTAMSSKKQSDVKAWEEEITSCTHTLNLEQMPSKPLAAAGNDSFSKGYMDCE